MKVLLLLVITVLSDSAFAAPRAYMDIAGALLGKLESPGVIRDYCAAKLPQARDEYRLLHENWIERNETTIVAVREALRRADGYLRQHKIASKYRSMDEVLESVTREVNGYLARKPLDQAIKFCEQFPVWLIHKDEEFKTEIPRLLEQFAEAEATGALRD